VSIPMKATKQHLIDEVKFNMLNKIVLTFGSADAILKCDHPNERYCALFSSAAV